MKAKIKATGEIVEVEDLYDDGTALVKGRYFKVSELDFFDNFETIDWEQRRYEFHILEKLEAETGMNVNVIYPVRQYAESKLTVEPAEHIKVDITLTL